MSEDLNNVVPVNGLDDCIAQPPKDDAAAACSEQQSLNGVAHAPSSSNVESVVSSEDGNHVSAIANSIAPPSMDEAIQVVIPDLNIAGPSRSRHNKKPKPVKTKKLFGYARGLEAKKIVNATKWNGQLMFLMSWKNSVDGEMDLVDADEVYNNSPQVAIKFFEERIRFAS